MFTGIALVDMIRRWMLLEIGPVGPCQQSKKIFELSSSVLRLRVPPVNTVTLTVTVATIRLL